MTPWTLHTKKSLTLLPRLQFEGLEARCMLSASTGLPARAIAAAEIASAHPVLARRIHVAHDAHQAVAVGNAVATFAAQTQLLVAQPTDDSTDDANPDDAPVKDVANGDAVESPIKTDTAVTDCPIADNEDSSDSTDPTVNDGQICDPDSADPSNNLPIFAADVAPVSTDDAGSPDTAADDASTGVIAIGEIRPIMYSLNGNLSSDAGAESTDTSTAGTTKLDPTDEISDSSTADVSGSEVATPTEVQPSDPTPVDSADSTTEPVVIYFGGTNPIGDVPAADDGATLHPTVEGSDTGSADSADPGVKPPIVYMNGDNPASGNQSEPGESHGSQTAVTDVIAGRIHPRLARAAIVEHHVAIRHRDRAIVALHALSGNRSRPLDSGQLPHNSIVVGDHTGLPEGAEPDLHAIDTVFDGLDDSSSTTDSARVAETATAPQASGPGFEL